MTPRDRHFDLTPGGPGRRAFLTAIAATAVFVALTFVTTATIEHFVPEALQLYFDFLNVIFWSAVAAATLFTLVPRGIEARVRANEQIREIIFQSLSDGVLLSDGEGTFIDVNEAGCAMFGYSRNEIVGSTVEKLSSGIPPYVQETSYEIFARVVESGAQIVDWQCRRKDGSLFWAEIGIRRMRLDNTELALAIVRDVTERKEAEEQIRRERDTAQGYLDRLRYLSATIEGISDPFLAVDENDCIAYLNRPAAAIFSKTPDQLLGKSLWEITPEERSSALKDRIDAARGTQEAQAFRSRSIWSGAWYDSIIYPLGAAFCIYGREITKQLAAEDAVKKGTQRQAVLAAFSLRCFASDDVRSLMEEALHIGGSSVGAEYAALVEANFGTDSFEIMWAAQSSPAQTGTSRLSEIPATSTVAKAIHAAHPLFELGTLGPELFVRPGHATLGLRACVGVSSTALDGRKIAILAWRMEEKAFSSADAEFLQTLCSLVGVVRLRGRGLEQLRLRDQALAAIAQGITINDERGVEPRITYTNTAFAKMTGYPVNEILGRRLRDMFLGERLQSVVDQVALARAKKRATTFELTARRKDGSTFLDRVAMAPIINTEGDLTHFVSIHDDITEERAREEKLREVQRLESIGQLTGGIAHEFNNLLAVVRSNAEDMRDEAGDAVTKKQADMVVMAADRGAALVQQLLTFSRKQDLKPEILDVRAELSKFIGALRRSLEANIALDVRTPDTPLWIYVDSGQFEDAIMNIALNARDAMPDGGTIIIEARKANFANGAVAARLRPGQYVEIVVSDNGTGMTPEIASRVFEPFFTTKPVGEGTGLGLSMVYGFARKSGGDARIYSEPDKGTSVKLYLPLADRDEAIVSSQGVQAHHTPAGGKILLVEDDELVRQTVSSKLARMGYGITAVGTAREALDAIEHSPEFGMVFSDVIMPGAMTGADLAREVQRRWPSTGILLTSGYTQAAVMGKVNMPPGVRLLSKPYSNADLARAIEETLAGR